MSGDAEGKRLTIGGEAVTTEEIIIGLQTKKNVGAAELTIIMTLGTDI